MQIYADENRATLSALDQLIEDHGALRTLLAFLAAWRRQKQSRGLYPYQLSDHMRRDIGLPPEMAHRNYWDLRL
ncbi:MAG: hypothetical protein ORN49_09390 [Rhodobacteraceae bacterium]|nr:hypothetical protein [Paracoccaceae bacterium]